MGSEGSHVCMAGTLTTRPFEVHSAKSNTVNPKIKIFFFGENSIYRNEKLGTHQLKLVISMTKEDWKSKACLGYREVRIPNNWIFKKFKTITLRNWHYHRQSLSVRKKVQGTLPHCHSHLWGLWKKCSRHFKYTGPFTPTIIKPDTVFLFKDIMMVTVIYVMVQGFCSTPYRRKSKFLNGKKSLTLLFNPINTCFLDSS